MTMLEGDIPFQHEGLGGFYDSFGVPNVQHPCGPYVSTLVHQQDHE